MQCWSWPKESSMYNVLKSWRNLFKWSMLKYFIALENKCSEQFQLQSAKQRKDATSKLWLIQEGNRVEKIIDDGMRKKKWSKQSCKSSATLFTTCIETQKTQTWIIINRGSSFQAPPTVVFELLVHFYLRKAFIITSEYHYIVYA